MPITRTPMVDDDGSGTSGTVVNNNWKVELYDQIDAAIGPALGLWTDVPFDAANFSVYSAGTWTVAPANIVSHAYMIIGKTMWLAFVASSMTVAGAPNFLRVKLPGGRTAARHTVMPFNLYDGQAANGVGYAQCTAGSGTVDFLRDLVGTPWGSGSMHVHAGNLIIPFA